MKHHGGHSRDPGEKGVGSAAGGEKWSPLWACTSNENKKDSCLLGGVIDQNARRLQAAGRTELPQTKTGRLSESWMY